MAPWSLTTIREKPLEDSEPKVVAHARYSVFEMADPRCLHLRGGDSAGLPMIIHPSNEDPDQQGRVSSRER